VPGFFLMHYDFVPPLSATTSIPPGKPACRVADMLVRLSARRRVDVSIRAAPPCRQRAVLGERHALPSPRRRSCRSGNCAGCPGAPMARLPRLIGAAVRWNAAQRRGHPRRSAERYGYVNRGCPTPAGPVRGPLPGASPVRQAVIADQALVDIPTLPSDAEIGAEWEAFLPPYSARSPAEHQAPDGWDADQARRRAAPAYYTGTLGQ